MKKLLLLLIPFTFLQAQQGLRSPAYVAQLQKAAAGSAPCTTLQMDNGATYDTSVNFSFYSYQASSFTTGGSGFTVCAADVEFDINSTPPAGTLTVAIYSDSSGSPGSVVGSASASVDRSLLATGIDYISFSSMSAALSSSTLYWFVIEASSADGGQVFWTFDTTGETHTSKGWTGSGGWDALGGSRIGTFKLYSE